MRTTGGMLVALLLLAAQPVLAGPRTHGHRAHHGRVGYRSHFGHHGYSGYGGYGYGHHGYYGHGGYHGNRDYRHYPRYYGSNGVARRGDASNEELGAVDLNVKPKNTRVYLNGHYLGVTGDFDGFPRQLWLEAGTHELKLLRPGSEPLVRELEIRPGVKLDVRHRIRSGSPEPPAVRERGRRRASGGR